MYDSLLQKLGCTLFIAWHHSGEEVVRDGIRNGAEAASRYSCQLQEKMMGILTLLNGIVILFTDFI